MMTKLNLPTEKFVVEPNSNGATLAIAHLVNEHYEISRTAAEMTQVSKMMGRVIKHLLDEGEKRRLETEALYRMVLPLVKKGGKNAP